MLYPTSVLSNAPKERFCSAYLWQTANIISKSSRPFDNFVAILFVKFLTSMLKTFNAIAYDLRMIPLQCLDRYCLHLRIHNYCMRSWTVLNCCCLYEALWLLLLLYFSNVGYDRVCITVTLYVIYYYESVIFVPFSY